MRDTSPVPDATLRDMKKTVAGALASGLNKAAVGLQNAAAFLTRKSQEQASSADARQRESEPPPASPPPVQTDAAPASAQPAASDPARRRRWMPGWFARRSRLGKVAIAGSLGVLLLLVVASLVASATLPLSRSLQPLPDPALTFLDANGEVFARRGGYKEAPVTFEEIPPHLIDALVAMEDRRFFYHPGVDPIGILRAGWRNFQAGRVVEGGSTITQQLAKITFLTSERTLDRKFQELLLALWIEAKLTKEEILVRYFSSAYFGSGAYGIRAAAHHYFDSEVKDLSIAESAMLVGVLKAPSLLAPTRDLKAAQERAALVIEAMVEDGSLSAEKADDIKPANLAASRDNYGVGSYFADWAAERMTADDAGYGEVRIETTLDARLQGIAEKAVRDVIGGEGEKRSASQAAVVVMRTDGRVVAMVGGKDYQANQFNRATQAKRQPGSAFKLFVYLAALRDGASPGSIVSDRPINIDGWQPKNFDGRYRGELTLQQAFALSVNTSAVSVSETAGRDNVIRAARDLGVRSDLTNTPSLALGASEVTLLEMTCAYAAVAAGRFPIPAQAITAIGGTPVYEGQAQQYRMEYAPQMQSLLHAVVAQGTGRGARLRVPAFGKTGTSEDYRDAWFVGFAGRLVIGVWVGNDDNSPMDKVTGGSLPAKIWRIVMTGAFDTEPALAQADDYMTRGAGYGDGYGSEEQPRRRGGGVRRFLRGLGLPF